MRRKKKEGVHWLEFELLADVPGLVHAVFLRHGGVSQGAYHSLNLGGSPEDEPENIKRNLEKIKEIIGVPLMTGRQCHGNKVAMIPSKNTRGIEACDGLMTKQKNLGLMIKHADCQAAIFYDPTHRAIANVHCGWRGNVQNIYAETIKNFKEQFSSDPKDILVCISPSLGPNASQFINYEQELPKSFLEFQFKPLYFDLWEISRKQLLDEGIKPVHIEIAGICTYANSEDFFSFRRDQRNTGHHATVVTLK